MKTCTHSAAIFRFILLLILFSSKPNVSLKAHHALVQSGPVTWQLNHSTATFFNDHKKRRPENLANLGDTINLENLKTKAGTPVYTFMEKPPVFPGGLSGLKDYLEKNSGFTIGPGTNSFAEKEIVVLIINETGEVEAVLIHKSLGAQADAEAISVLSAMPNWQPAKQKNKYVAAALSLFLRFK